MKITVVQADYRNQEQAGEIAALMNHYAQDPMGGGQALDESVQRSLASELAKIPNAFSLLCYVEGQPAGLVNCLPGFSTFKCKPLINIHDVVVASPYRGLGLCRKMLAQVEQIAVQRGCCKITLEVLEGNGAAQQAYLKAGFAGYQLGPELGKALFWEKVLDETGPAT